MAENSSKFWLLTFEYFKKDINKPEDNLIILVHWLLLKNNFQALGAGNENEIDENEQPSDSLPTNWSQDVTYKLRYMRDKILFLLNGVKAGDGLIFNFYNVATKQVSSAALGNISSTVQWISDLANNKDNFYETINLLEKDLIDPMKKVNDDTKAVSTQTQVVQPEDTPHSSLLVSEPIRYVPNIPRSLYRVYGAPDLDPCGGLRNPGEGMLFDPMHKGNRRAGSNPGFPLGSRFDPMHPPNPDPMMPGNLRRPRPDNIPDFDSDLYM